MAKKEISVLIVDDEEAFRYMLSALLTNAGFAVETAVDGVAARAEVETFRSPSRWPPSGACQWKSR